jgi:ketopantoate reductase
MLPTNKKDLQGMQYSNKDGIRKKLMIIIEENLDITHFDLIFTSPQHKTTNFTIDRGETMLYFLVDLTSASSLISCTVDIHTYSRLFTSSLLLGNWNVESIRFSMLKKLLEACPKDDVTALSESLLGQLNACEHDLVQDSIRAQMKTLLRSYSPLEAIKTY